MLILALDTTVAGGSVALIRDDETLAVVRGDATRSHGERLPAEIADTLTQAGVPLAAVNLLVVASGPGAFTGLRIGIATVQGIALVHGIPTVGVSALDALASVALGVRAEETVLCAWMDAQRHEVFAARYGAATLSAWSPRSAEEAVVGAPGPLLDTLVASGEAPLLFIGDGAVRYRDLIRERLADSARVLEPPPALAPALARLGREQALQHAAGPPHTLQPLYVRRSDAELARAQPVVP